MAITSFISPYISDRHLARKLHQDDNIPFIEVYINVPIAVAEERDPKGLYKKARNGEIKGFTGIDAPYEEPLNPEILIHNDKLTVEQAVGQIYNYLVLNEFLQVSSKC